MQLNENFIKRRFLEISFCLFCNFRGSKPSRTQTQNREKQRNSLITEIAFASVTVNSLLHDSENVGPIPIIIENDYKHFIRL
jgi:hypothetical protein